MVANKDYELDSELAKMVTGRERAKQQCAHRFIVRDVEGDNNFLCRECDERWPRHPEVMEKEKSPMLDVGEAMRGSTSFNDGDINLYQLADKLAITPHQASEFIRNTFETKPTYEEMYPLGSKKPISIQVGNMPARTSNPLEIDAYFKANFKTVLEGHDSVLYSDRYDTYDKFPDIVSIDINVDCPPIQTNLRLRPISIDSPMYCMIKFNDGSIQRVDIDGTL